PDCSEPDIAGFAPAPVAGPCYFQHCVARPVWLKPAHKSAVELIAVQCRRYKHQILYLEAFSRSCPFQRPLWHALVRPEKSVPWHVHNRLNVATSDRKSVV